MSDLTAQFVGFFGTKVSTGRYDLTRKGLLRDRVDVALAEQRAAAGAGQFSPTVESLLPPPGSQSIVEVSWEGETGRIGKNRARDRMLFS